MSKKTIRIIEKCRACESKNLIGILSLGDLYVSNFLDKPNDVGTIQAPLELVLCNIKDGGCGLLQLKDTVSAEDMYRQYWYQSGINQSMKNELKNIAENVEKVAALKDGDYVIDIGANDGTMLRSFSNKNLNTVGFEPAENLKVFNQKGTTKIISNFFNFNEWEKEFPGKKAKAITAVGMFYDLDEPNVFLSDLVKCLDEDGLFVIQMMYLPFALEKNAFDGICHEHLEYYSLTSLENLLEKHELEVFDVEIRENVNEGSLRIYIKRQGRGKNLNPSQDANFLLKQLRQKEIDLKLNEVTPYQELAKRIEETKRKVVELISEQVRRGKKVHGYAASTKGNTTLQYYGLGPELIEAIADRNPVKWGKYTAGTNIPVISEEDSRSAKPDYYFILAWHFLPEFLEREKDFFERGGKFIVPMPEFKIIENDL